MEFPTRFAFLAVAALGVVAVAAACGGSKKEEAPGSVVNVVMKEWSLTPDKASVPAGAVTFSATNSGTVEHELVILKTDLPVDGLKVSSDEVDEGASGKKIGEIEEFKPGKTQRGTFNLQEGKYVLFCNIKGHYQAGVRVGFGVGAIAPSSKSPGGTSTSGQGPRY